MTGPAPTDQHDRDVDPADDADVAPQPVVPVLEFLEFDTDGGGVCDANGVCS